MSIAFEVMEKAPLSLAVVFGTDEGKTNENLSTFLIANKVGDTARYFYQMAVKKNGIRIVTHFKYGSVPVGTKNAGSTMVVNLPAQKYLSVLMDADSYIPFIDGEYKSEMDNAMLMRSLKLDVSKIFPFGELTDSGSYRIYFPVK